VFPPVFIPPVSMQFVRDDWPRCLRVRFLNGRWFPPFSVPHSPVEHGTNWRRSLIPVVLPTVKALVARPFFYLLMPTITSFEALFAF